MRVCGTENGIEANENTFFFAACISFLSFNFLIHSLLINEFLFIAFERIWKKAFHNCSQHPFIHFFSSLSAKKSFFYIDMKRRTRNALKMNFQPSFEKWKCFMWLKLKCFSSKARAQERAVIAICYDIFLIIFSAFCSVLFTFYRNKHITYHWLVIFHHIFFRSKVNTESVSSARNE